MNKGFEGKIWKEDNSIVRYSIDKPFEIAKIELEAYFNAELGKKAELRDHNNTLVFSLPLDE